MELDCELKESEDSSESDKILGNIYIGKVDNIVPSINAAFISFGNEQIGYYSLEENHKHNIINSKKSGKLMIGDQLLIQVSKENVKSKAPVVTSKISLTGKYSVLTVGNTHMSFSGKINKKTWKKELAKISENLLTDEFGFIIRTNAAMAEFDLILDEMKALIKEYNRLKTEAKYRSCFSLIYKAPSTYLTNIRDVYTKDLEEILTDDETLYSEIKEYLTKYQPMDLTKLKLYEDKLWPLSKVYSIETVLEKALMKQVWLKSGGYLVIEQTEAFVVIDVNTGKFAGNKNQQDTIIKINLEAAKEIARQLRLRNLSGIIVVDFIDMASNENKELLMSKFATFLSKDPIKTVLVGMSKLNLVELTRKKVKKPLYEQLTTTCYHCHGNGRVAISKNITMEDKNGR
ncbi:MAG: ribonuclease E/G [Clostridiales bacterium]|nr:ribonuclease E/G [Clostridiales bacterium]